MTIKRDYLESKPINMVNIPTIFKKIKNNNDAVRFSLFCAKDCFLLMDERKQSFAQSCIQKIEQHLSGQRVPKEEIEQLFREHGYIYEDRSYALTATIDALRSIHYSTPMNVVYYASHSYLEFTNNQEVYQLKQIEYKSYAVSLLRTSDVNKSLLKIKGKIDDRSTLMALLDNLIELNEDIVTIKDNTLQLNYPMNIIASNIDELIEEIMNNQALIHYLEKLYN